mmetsp:Transcript_34216/g.33439  ORF Transcript_34216/g.33439 Transcript_34216/m.33439 type:complete len:85 (+) Transcript_34216:1795-2049(+)
MKKIVQAMGKQFKDKDVENVKLKVSKEFEIRIKDMERSHFEKITLTKQEAKRAFDITLDNMKSIYEDEIKALKAHRKEQDEKVN